jgi:Trk K+ transport system NAD-binding subunit
LEREIGGSQRSDSCPNSRLTLGEAIVQEDSSLVAKSVQELGGRLGDLVFVAIETADGNLIMRPPGGQTFNPADVIICADTQGDIQEVSLAASSTALAV